VGKGTHRALDRCTHFVRRYPGVLQCDVEKFFPTILTSWASESILTTVGSSLAT